LGDWAHGFFALSFIGALNVGSIVVNFDSDLESNIPMPTKPYFNDQDYTLVNKQINN